MMVDEGTVSAEFNEEVVQDRAAMIRRAAKENKNKSKKTATSGSASLAAGKSSKKVFDKLILNANNAIWGMSIAILPLFGLTLLISLLLILALFFVKIFSRQLKGKGIEIKISIPMLMYTWGTMVAHLLITVIMYVIIYIIINPVDFSLDVLGL